MERLAEDASALSRPRQVARKDRLDRLPGEHTSGPGALRHSTVGERRPRCLTLREMPDVPVTLAVADQPHAPRGRLELQHDPSIPAEPDTGLGQAWEYPGRTRRL